MAHITIDETKPGMRSLLAYFPALADPLTGLMEVMMRGHLGLHPGERELIATFVSGLNNCSACENIHGAVVCQHPEFIPDQLEAIRQDYQNAPVSARVKAILTLASSVQKGGNHVSSGMIESLKKMGFSDLEIHDTVLIAAMFCMFNRYLDGLGILSHDTTTTLTERSKQIAQHGYSG